MAGIGAAGSLGSAAIGAGAAGSAAQQQERAAQQAIQAEKQYSGNALDFQNGIWSGTQQNLQPFLQTGQWGLGQEQSGIQNLQTLLGLGGNTNAPGYGSLAQGFQAPTLQQAENEPGYQFALQQGEGALQNSAAAKGNLLSGNSQEALQNYAQNAATQNYNNVYNRSFNTFEANQGNTFNRLMALQGLNTGLAGTGLNAANSLGSFGQSAANTNANINMGAGSQISNDLLGIGAAQASGTVGAANAWGGGLSGATNGLSNLMLLNQLYGGGGGGGGNYAPSMQNIDWGWQ